CGAANNPLAAEADADRLVRRGVAYVPDFVANAGALIDGASRALGEEARIPARVAALPVLVRDLLDRAEAEGRSPHHIAIELAERRLADLRDRSL
ncbi:MAG: leucine dehydrogenase, partial [Myxococcales bacterium]|nr:leucine dehydrogenase [Myxococcales bacterium]